MAYYYHELYDHSYGMQNVKYGKLRYFKDEFEVYDPPLVKGGVPRENHTKWVLPDELTVLALFPKTGMKDINETNVESIRQMSLVNKRMMCALEVSFSRT